MPHLRSIVPARVLRRSSLGSSPRILLVFFLLTFGSTTADGIDGPPRTTEPWILTDRGGATVLTGAPLARGETPVEAVARFWERWGEAVGVAAETSVRTPVHIATLGGRDGVVFADRLARDLPAHAVWPGGAVAIEGGTSRLLVIADEARGDHVVIHASIRTALSPATGFPPVRVDAALARAIAERELAALPLSEISSRSHGVPATSFEIRPPRLVLTPGSIFARPRLLERGAAATGEEIPARLAWKVGATAGNAAWEVAIDPTTGRLLEVVDALLHIDVEGTVEGAVTPAPFPASPLSPPVVVPLAGATVENPTGGSTLVLPDGSFVLPNAGSAMVDVTAHLFGEWVTIFDGSGGTVLEATDTVLPPGPADLLFTPTDAFTQAHVDAFHWGTATHDFIRARTATGIPGIDVPLSMSVNLPGECAANFNPFAQSLNFTRGLGTCVNEAFSNVISHEYGHFVVDRLGLAQGAFGEGYGDTLAMLIGDSPFVGIDYFGPGTVLRDPIADQIQYPCSQGIHTCGEILSSVWWRTRDLLVAELGAADGLEAVRQRFVDWSVLTAGATETSGIDLGIATELFILDDDNGTILDGTPHFAELCAILSLHAVPCPPVPPVRFTLVEGPQTHLFPGLPNGFTFTIEDGYESADAASAMLFFREEGAPTFTAVPIVTNGGGEFFAEVPAQLCGATIEVYAEVASTVGTVVRIPGDGAADRFTFPVATTRTVLVFDDLEIDNGWVVGDPTDTATAGVWQRVDPIGTDAAPEDDHSDPGSFCFVTGQGFLAGTNGAADVDGGTTTLMTPSFDLSAPGNSRVTYWRWFSNDVGPSPSEDVFRVELSVDDGANWSPVETVGPAGDGTSGGWIEHRFFVNDLAVPTAAVRLRFIAEDLGGASIIEAGIDDLLIERFGCEPVTILRRGDASGNGSIDLGDAIQILAHLFGGDPIGCRDAIDIDDDGIANLADPIGLLQYLFNGGEAPSPPFPSCGPDRTPDALTCDTPPSCP